MVMSFGFTVTSDGLFMKVGLVGVKTEIVFEYGPHPTPFLALTL
jgi:hypothetical protein